MNDPKQLVRAIKNLRKAAGMKKPEREAQTMNSKNYYALFYEYTDNIAEKRTPYREGHLSLVSRYQSEAKIILAGAYTDPLDGALLVFKVDDKTEVTDFVGQDPYVKNGLVTAWKIRSWNVVAGSAFTG